MTIYNNFFLNIASPDPVSRSGDVTAAANGSGAETRFSFCVPLVSSKNIRPLCGEVHQLTSL